MDSQSQSHSSRIDEFTESVEQLWQSEEQQMGGSSESGSTNTEPEHGT